MPSATGRIRLFYAELKRRKVVRTAVAYTVAAAAVIQLADPVTTALHWPSSALTAVVFTAVAGFPVALVLAWLFDITRDSTPPIAQTEHTAETAQPLPPAAHVYSLDIAVTPLIAREAELETSFGLLSDPDCRILTLTGPGGIGKTRLAQEIAARQTSAYSHGACFVALAGVEAVESLPPALADALGFDLSTRESPIKELAGFLREKNLLLVLDNFEQIVDGAALLTELLVRASGVRLLVTSRRRLRIAGENVLQLDALSLPAPGAPIESSAAARLFLQIARRNDPRFTPNATASDAIARICRVADGIPLAIELAAASVGILSCEEIAREIDERHQYLLIARRDLPPRHQSLSAAFESSWRLLDAEEQRAFRRLSVFRTGFDRDAAQTVAGADLRLLARLVEASLLHRSMGPFAILEVLRQFGEEKLAENDAEAVEVSQRHADYFLGRLVELTTLPDGSEKDAALDRLAASSVDVRAAWMAAAARGAYKELGRAAHGLFLLLETRGRGGEGADLFHRAVETLRPVAAAPDADSAGATAALARVLTRKAAFILGLGRTSEAAESLAEGLALLRAEGDRAEIAFALSNQCKIARATGSYRSPEYEEALALYREIGDLPGVARSLNALGGARHAAGEYGEAKRLYRESVDLFRRIGLEGEAWTALNNLAGIAQIEGDFAGARSILEEELRAARMRQNPRALSLLLINLGYVLYRSGDHAAADPIVAESAALAREMGYRSLLGYSLNTLANIQLERGQLDLGEQTYRSALAVGVETEEAPLITAVLVGVARLQVRRGATERAAAILAAVEAYPACDQETRSGARALLDRIDSSRISDIGTPMALDEVVRTVLETGGAPMVVMR